MAVQNPPGTGMGSLHFFSLFLNQIVLLSSLVFFLFGGSQRSLPVRALCYQQCGRLDSNPLNASLSIIDGIQEGTAKFCTRGSGWFYSGRKSHFWDEKDSQKALKYNITTPWEVCSVLFHKECLHSSPHLPYQLQK